jgi:LL-H family phage holin
MVDWSGLLFEVFTIVFLAVTSMALQALFIYLKRKGVLDAIAAKEELALIAVQFVQQAYRDYNGPAKFDAAIEYLAYSLSKHGIKISATEMESLIESAVYEMNQAWLDVVEDE